MSNKEIDLIDLFINLIKFIKRKFLILFAFGILGAIIGFANYYLTGNLYSTNIYTTPIKIDKEILQEFIKPINSNVIKEEYKVVSNELNISLKSAKEIRNIELDTSNTTLLKIKIILENKKNIDSLANGIINYINNIKTVKDYINIRLSRNNLLISKIDTELVYLKKTQDLVLTNLKNNNSDFFNVQTANVNEQIIKLYEKKLNLEDKNKLLKPIQIYSDMEYSFVSENRLIVKLLKWGLIVLFIGFIITLIIEFNNKIKDYK